VVNPTPQTFPVPTLADLQSMDADHFELFWRSWQHLGPFYVPHWDIQRAIILKHAGWSICDPIEPCQVPNNILWAFGWKSPSSHEVFNLHDAYMAYAIRSDIRAELIRLAHL
jgi:hypothetical protein